MTGSFSPNRNLTTLKELLLLLLGVILLLFGLLMILGSLLSDPEQPQTVSPVVDLIFMIVFGFVPAGIGGWLIVRCVMRSKKRKRDLFENQVLKLVHELGGRMTAAELAMSTSLSLTEAANLLEQYRKRGIVTVKIAENGTFVFHFEGIVTEKQKRHAEGVDRVF